MRRLVARRYQVVRHRTRIKNEVHAILHAHLIPKCPHADLFNGRGRDWLSRQPLPDDEHNAIRRHVNELDRLGEDLVLLDRDIARSVLDEAAIKRLMTITGVNLTVAAGLMAAIDDISRFKGPQKLVSYFRLNPRVRQSGEELGAPRCGASQAARDEAGARDKVTPQRLGPPEGSPCSRLMRRCRSRTMRKHRPSPSSSPALDCKTMKSLDNFSDGL